MITCRCGGGSSRPATGVSIAKTLSQTRAWASAYGRHFGGKGASEVQRAIANHFIGHDPSSTQGLDGSLHFVLRGGWKITCLICIHPSRGICRRDRICIVFCPNRSPRPSAINDFLHVQCRSNILTLTLCTDSGRKLRVAQIYQEEPCIFELQSIECATLCDILLSTTSWL